MNGLGRGSRGGGWGFGQPTVGRIVWLLLLAIGLTGGCGLDGEEGPDRLNAHPQESDAESPDSGEVETDSSEEEDTDRSEMADVPETTDSTDTDATSPDGCNGVICTDGELCLDDACVTTADYQCRQSDDLGRLTAGEVLTLSGTFDGTGIDGLKTACADTEGAFEQVFRFQTAEPMIVSMQSTWSGGSGPGGKVEFRRGGCRNVPAERTVCRQRDRDLSFDAEETIFVVVEDDFGAGGTFEIDLTATPIACTPGETSCTGAGQRQSCTMQGGQPTPVGFDCPMGACAGTACLGNSCANPIAITAPGVYSYAGASLGYDDSMSFANNPRCAIESQTVESPGREVVFAVEMTQGQRLTVDTTADRTDNLVYIGTACQPQAADWDCLVAADLEPASHEFTAPFDGTFHVVVDAWSAPTPEERFSYNLTLQ